MKFRRLTKQELEPLAEDFAIFLASNSIDKKLWDEMKAERPVQVEESLDIFSDLVFEKALSSAKYLERVTETEIHCYAFHASQAHLISAMSLNGITSFIDGNFSETLQKMISEQKLEFVLGTKKCTAQRELEMFEILKTGAVLSDGKLYQSLLALL